MRATRNQTLKALGFPYHLRCAEVCFVAIYAYRLDPFQLYDFQAIAMFRRMWTEVEAGGRASRTQRGQLMEMHQAARDVTEQYGPLTRVRSVLRTIRWTWPEVGVFVDADRKVWNLADCELGALYHAVREALRRRECTKAALRRTDMVGLEAGIDRSATRKLLDSGKLTPYEQGILRNILAAAIWTQLRLAHKSSTPCDETCPHCGQAAEDALHMYWFCGAWDELRAEFLPRLPGWEQYAPCTLNAGLIPYGSAAVPHAEVIQEMMVRIIVARMGRPEVDDEHATWWSRPSTLANRVYLHDTPEGIGHQAERVILAPVDRAPADKRRLRAWEQARAQGQPLYGYQCRDCKCTQLTLVGLRRMPCRGTEREHQRQVQRAKTVRLATIESTYTHIRDGPLAAEHDLCWSGKDDDPVICLRCGPRMTVAARGVAGPPWSWNRIRRLADQSVRAPLGKCTGVIHPMNEQRYASWAERRQGRHDWYCQRYGAAF